MDEKRFREVFDRLLSNHKENSERYKEYLIDRYGKDEVKKMENVSGIVDETLNYALDELLDGITEDNKHPEYFTDRQGRELL